MRFSLAAIVMVGLTAVVGAQTRVPAPVFGPLSPIGLPLARIEMPLAPIGLPSTIGTRTHAGSTRPSGPIRSQQQRFNRRDRFDSGRSVVFFVPTYGWGYPLPPEAVPDPGLVNQYPQYHQSAPPTGGLRLDLQPDRDLQLYVDGYYVGTSEDFGSELELPAGPHRVEISSPGYETLGLDVRISEGRSITYRGALKPIDTKPTPDAVPPTTDAGVRTPSTIYIIPGCYIGNVPPKDVALPASCDLSRTTTLEK